MRQSRSCRRRVGAGGGRLLLGVGEGGGFPAATRAVAEWFPVNDRATAMGIINAGTAVGAVVAPPLIGADPWDLEFLWQHMYRKTMAFGRKGLGMVAISAVDIALWDILGQSAKQPVYRLLGGRTKPKIPVYASRLYSTPLEELARESKR